MARSHTILSLDLASTTGWAFLKDGVIEKSGVVRLVDKDAHPGDRWRKFKNMLVGFKNVNEIIYESVPMYDSTRWARIHAGLVAHLEDFVLMYNIRCTTIQATSVKLEFAGHGHAQKADMCKTAHRLGWKGGVEDTDIDHDECDAIAAAWVILSRRGVQPKFKDLQWQEN